MTVTVVVVQLLSWRGALVQHWSQSAPTLRFLLWILFPISFLIQVGCVITSMLGYEVASRSLGMKNLYFFGVLVGLSWTYVLSVRLARRLAWRARRRVVGEALRVLRPGGLFVVCDSAQLGDGPALRPFLEAFPRIYHEPYYKSYLKDDLASLLKEAGAEVLAEEPAFLAKVVVGARPG